MADVFIGERPYYELSIEELLVKLTEARAELDGYITQTTTTGGGGSTSVQFSQAASVQRRMRAIRRELHLKDPDTYPMNQPLRRTTPRFV